MERFAAERVAELSDPLTHCMAPLSDERWLACRPKARELLVVDRRLEPIWRLGLPSRRRGRHAVTKEDLSRVALSLQHEVLVLSGDGEVVCEPGDLGPDRVSSVVAPPVSVSALRPVRLVRRSDSSPDLARDLPCCIDGARNAPASLPCWTGLGEGTAACWP